MKSILAFLILVVIFFIPSGSPAEFYRYTDKDGTVCFTDNPANVPEDQRWDARCYGEPEKDVQWESSTFYQMAEILSKSGLRSMDGVFDCDDWAISYLIYKEKFCNIEEPSVIFALRKSSYGGHALALFKEAGKYVVCDSQVAIWVECDTLEEAKTAAIGLWISLFKIDVPDHSDFYTLVAPLDEVLKRMYR